MANRYWVGGGSSTSWDATGNTNWSATDGGGNNVDVPVAGDDVFFRSSANCDLTGINTAKLNSLDMTGYTGTFSGSGAITLGAVSGTQNLILGGTFTNIGGIMFRGSASTTTNFNPNGKTVGSIYANAKQSQVISLQGALTVTGGIDIDESTFTTNGHSITAESLSSYHGGDRTINLGSSALTLSAGSGNYSIFFLAIGLTLNAGTSTISCTGDGNFVGAGKTFATVTFSGNGQVISSDNTFGTLNISTAGKATGLVFTAGSTQTVTNFTTNGSSGSLAKISSSSGGSSFTLYKASGTVAVTYMSIKDSAATGGATWGARFSTSVSGNSGWNIVPARYWIGGGFSTKWDATGNTNWSEDGVALNSTVPEAGYDVLMKSSADCIVNMDTAELNSFDMSGYSGTLSGGSNILVAPQAGSTIMRFGGTVTWNGQSRPMPYAGATVDFYSSGKTLSVFLLVGEGTVNLKDALNCGAMIFWYGTFNSNDYDVTVTSTVTKFGTMVWNAGGSTINLTGTGDVWRGPDFNAGTSTIAISNTSSTSKVFDGNGETYNIVTFSGDNIRVDSANTFNTINVNNAGRANGLIFSAAAGANQTVTNFTTNGSPGSLAKISTSSPGSQASLICSSGDITVHGMEIKDINATGGASWHAVQSTNVSGNTGWNFFRPTAVVMSNQ